MDIGVVFPQTEFGNNPAAIKDYAQTAETLGYTHILAYDHVIGANPERPGGWHGPYTYKTPFHEVFTLFSFMAAVTQKIEFVTGILILPQRQTVLAAKQAA
jgi:alkanesulfonate monooxygenase SsuD/methylene tetrahydromethanopterin reductase-like flavin-dependent oxidoreductase (luciferase family)